MDISNNFPMDVASFQGCFIANSPLFLVFIVSLLPSQASKNVYQRILGSFQLESGDLWELTFTCAPCSEHAINPAIETRVLHGNCEWKDMSEVKENGGREGSEQWGTHVGLCRPNIGNKKWVSRT